MRDDEVVWVADLFFFLFFSMLSCVSQAGRMGEGLMDVSILMTFNKLKKIVKTAGLSPEDGLAMVRVCVSPPFPPVSSDRPDQINS